MKKEDQELISRAATAAFRLLAESGHSEFFKAIVKWLLANTSVLHVEFGSDLQLFWDIKHRRPRGESVESFVYTVLERYGLPPDNYAAVRRRYDRYFSALNREDENEKDVINFVFSKVLPHLAPLPPSNTPAYHNIYKLSFSPDELDNWWHV